MFTIPLDGVDLKFGKLTLADEEAFKEWLQKKIKMDAKADADDWGLAGDERVAYFAKVSANIAGDKCALLSPLGVEHAQTVEGSMELLRLSSLHHIKAPGIDKPTLRRLLFECKAEVEQLFHDILPKQSEKKATAGPKDGQSGTP